MTITCPWCGTSYLQFQPNCKNCGGPLQPPPRVLKVVSQAEEPIPAPPPPPRPISDRYAWRLLRSDGYTIAAGIFLLLGFIFTITGLPLMVAIITALAGLPFFLLGLAFLVGGGIMLVWRYQIALRIVRVLREGTATEGRILSLEMNPSVKINGSHPWKVEYGFQVNGREYTSNMSTLNIPGPHHHPGRRVCVLYLPEAPEISSLYPHP